MDTIPEKAIQSQIMGVLRYNGFYVQRMNSGGIRMPYTFRRGARAGSTKSNFIRGTDPGTPDVMAFKVIDGHIKLFFIEVKRPGNEPTFLQKSKMEQLTDHGAICFVATSVDDVVKNIPSVVY